MSEYWPQILLTIGGIATAVAAAWGGIRQVPVSYTHLTLPTSDLV